MELATPAEALFNLAAARIAQGRRPAGIDDGGLCPAATWAEMSDLLHVVAKGGGGGDAPGGGVGLLQQARLAQDGHHVAQRGGTQTFAISKEAGKCLRCHWLARGNVHFDDGCQHQPLARAEA